MNSDETAAHFERVGEVVGFLDSIAGPREKQSDIARLAGIQAAAKAARAGEDIDPDFVGTLSTRHQHDPNHASTGHSIFDSDGRIIIEKADNPALSGALLVRNAGSRFEFLTSHCRITMNVSNHDPEAVMDQLRREFWFIEEIAPQAVGLAQEPHKGTMYVADRGIDGGRFSRPDPGSKETAPLSFPDIKKAIGVGYRAGFRVAPGSAVDGANAGKLVGAGLEL